MGNDISTEQNKSDMSNIHKIVNHIASDYIFTSNFKDMENLGDVKYCNNLVILTSRIIEENLNDLDIDYLSRKIKDGNTVDEMAKEKVIFLKKNDIPKLDVKNDTQKRRLCVGIAKFYVKVAHIFASIIKTINPTISYVDNKGNAGETTLMDKHKLPEDASMKMNNISLCSKRLDILVNDNDYNVTDKKNKVMVVSPDYCNKNSRNVNVNLLQEPGMVELEKLYNDKYDYESGKYIGMSDTMKNKYKRDLEIFYKAFSDSSEPFDSKKIKKFSDIKLREHHNHIGCSNKDGKGEYLIRQEGKYEDKLFADYANHIKKMMDNTQKNQDQLLSVIDKLFVFVNITDESKPDNKLIMINPSLTEVKLQSVVEESRKIIMNLYITCEKDFLKGLEIFEAIVEKKIRDTTIDRINNLGIRKDTERRNDMNHNDRNHNSPITPNNTDEERRSEDEESSKDNSEGPTIFDRFKNMATIGNSDDDPDKESNDNIDEVRDGDMDENNDDNKDENKDVNKDVNKDDNKDENKDVNKDNMDENKDKNKDNRDENKDENKDNRDENKDENRDNRDENKDENRDNRDKRVKNADIVNNDKNRVKNADIVNNDNSDDNDKNNKPSFLEGIFSN